MSLGTTRMHADDPRPESVLGRRLARCRRPRRPQNAPSERPADGVGEGDVNHARPRQGHQRKLVAQAFDLIGRLICRGGVRIGQTQLTILRLHMPWAGLQGVRAQRPTLCRFGPDLTHGHVRVGDLCLAVPGSHRELPGDPGGALQARRTVPTARDVKSQSPVGRKGLTRLEAC